VFCEIIGQEQRLSPEVELTAFRIVQEALTNVRKHASGADRVYVTVQFKAHVLEVSVEDNGQGFHLPGGEPASRGEHLGLIGMQERAELLGGTLAIFAQPGEGTRIVFKLPKTVLSHSLEEQALGHLAPA
jgi:signal transduction histidine kinase